MLSSIQRIAFSMKNQAERMNVIANNIANVNTRAYKKEVLSTKSFEEVLISAIDYNSGSSVPIGSVSLGVSSDDARTSYTQGNVQETGFNTDVAIMGKGFFVLDTPEGIRYTRAGNFKIDPDGYLITQNGSYVLGERGRVFLDNKNLKINKEGKLENGDTLRIAEFSDLSLLEKADGGNYTNNNPQNLKIPENNIILQGFLEDSNVSIVEETRDMMASKRNYESCQQMIKMLDDTLGKAASIGSL